MEIDQCLSVSLRKARTVGKSISFSGIGIHTCQEVYIKFCPAKEGTGIIFKRVDLPDCPTIPALLNSVKDTNRSTTIGNDQFSIHTVEHLLSAVKAFGIDDLMIEISNIEPPVGNGSADIFVAMIEEAGVVEQSNFLPVVKIEKPLYWSKGGIDLIALPCDDYRISYTLNYENNRFLKAQFFSLSITPQIYKKEIAPCRTFSLYEELSTLIDKGLIKGGSLDNAVVVKDDLILSKGGLYFDNEMARHKILDLIGDLSLIGVDFTAHIIAVKSGHPSNHAFAKVLYNHIVTESR